MILVNINDLVVVKNEKKIIYIIKEIYENNKECLIKGLNHRLTRIVEMANLILATSEDVAFEEKINKNYYFGVVSQKNRNKKYLLGKILHIDGDSEYLKKCLDLYEEVGIYVYGVSLDEKKLKNEITSYLNEINPDIIVITGHDFYNGNGLKEIDNYTNTRFFMDAIKEIRQKKNNSCIIIAGACQSNFEALIASGADFAFSPKRINIHTFDPAIIAIKAATTSFVKIVQLDDITKYIENGKDAFGGVQTYGKMRLML